MPISFSVCFTANILLFSNNRQKGNTMKFTKIIIFMHQMQYDQITCTAFKIPGSHPWITYIAGTHINESVGPFPAKW